jgi:PAS domain S-box-containing protein
MNLAYSPYAMPLLVAAVLSAVVALYVWPRRNVEGATQLALIAAVIAIWSFGYALEIMASDLAGKIFWGKSQYIGITFAPYFWLVFAVAYTRQGQARPWFRLRWLAILPLTTTLLAFTTDWHGLIWAEMSVAQQTGFAILAVSYGAWFWLHFAASYLFLLAGTIILLRGMWRMQGLYRAQVVALLVAILAPWVSNILFFANLSPIPGLDLTPFAFTITVVALAWGILGYRLVDIAPIARDLVVEGMREGLMVINGRGRIADLNPAAARIIGLSVDQALGQWATEVLAPWPHLIDELDEVGEVQSAITVGQGASQVRYGVRATSLYDQQKRPLGRLLTLQEGGGTAVPTRSRMVPTAQLLGPKSTAEPPPIISPFWQTISRFFVPPPLEAVQIGGIESVRLIQLLERSFTSMLRIAAVLGGISLLFSVPQFWASGAQEVLFLFMLGIVGAALLGLVRSIKFTQRTFIFLLLLYGIALVELLNYGYSPEAVTFFLTLVVAGMVVQGWRRGVVIALFSFCTLAVFGGLIATGVYQPLSIPANVIANPSSVRSALALLMVILASGASLAVIIVILLQSINWAWLQETQTKNLLQQERDLLEERVEERTQQLLNSEANLRAFINSTPAIIVQVDATQKVVFGRIPGMAEEDVQAGIIGRHLLDFIHPTDHALVQQSLAQALATSQTMQVEFKAYNPVDNTYHPYLTSIAPFLDGEHQLSVLLICTDISERQEVEAALLRLTQEQTVILDNTAAAIFMQKNRRTVWANPAAERLTGYSLAEAQNLPGAALHATPESYAAFTQFVAAPLDRGERVTTEIQLRHKDGQLRWVEITGQGVNPENPRKDGILWIMQDITERKEAELALQQTVQELERLTVEQKIILDNVPAAIFMQKERSLVWGNHSTEQILGYTAEEMRHLPNVTYHVSPEAYEEFGALAVAQQAQGGISTTEIQIRHKDGSLRWVYITGQAINPERVREEGVLWIMQDISERKQAEAALQAYAEQLALARDQALEASQYKSLLLGKVSHELRTPLGGILGYAELLRDEIAGPLVPDQRDFVAYMIEATKHLNSLITDLLDQAQIEQGTVKISPRPVHLPDTLFFLRDLLQPLAAKKGLGFVLETDPDLPQNIIADEKRLRQIIINLATNAIKFTETGMVKVVLQRLGSAQWQIEISDTGPGIELEVQKRIFDSFWQLDGSPSSLHKGYGLGLSIVQQLLVLMGGTIEVSSELGRGSTFIVVLPLVISNS